VAVLAVGFVGWLSAATAGGAGDCDKGILSGFRDLLNRDIKYK
jgi:hypothetical protein